MQQQICEPIHNLYSDVIENMAYTLNQKLYYILMTQRLNHEEKAFFIAQLVPEHDHLIVYDNHDGYFKIACNPAQLLQ